MIYEKPIAVVKESKMANQYTFPLLLIMPLVLPNYVVVPQTQPPLVAVAVSVEEF